MVLIKGLQKTTTVDYPGKLACAIFTAGCNFRCPFCHNPELIDKERYKKIETITEEEFFEFIEGRRKWIDGVVITGGEPCLQKDLPEFIKKIKDMDFLVKLDTNGSNPEMLRGIIEKRLVDFIAMDIKAPLERYNDVVKVNINTEKIKESIELVKNAGKAGIDCEFRLTVVPTLHTKEDIKKISELLKGSKKIALQQFNNKVVYDTAFKDIKPYSGAEMAGFKRILGPCFDEVEIRGV